MAKREALRARARRFKKRTVPTPEWAPECPEVVAREFTSRERDAWEIARSRALSRGDEEGAPADGQADPCIRASAVVIASLDPETGHRLFEDEDLDWLAEEGATVVDRIYGAIAELSGIRETKGEPEKNASPSSPPASSLTS
jgi:hypothetical protein